MGMKNVTVTDAHARQGQGYTYVDVRTVAEYEAAHPAGAINVPLLNRDPATGQMTPNPEFLIVMQSAFPPDAHLLVGCQAGMRSLQAAQLLSNCGFTDVSNVTGGFGGGRDPMTGAPHQGWLQAALPTDSGAPEGRSYKDVRAKAAGAR